VVHPSLGGSYKLEEPLHVNRLQIPETSRWGADRR
jgi:hypothetical protein